MAYFLQIKSWIKARIIRIAAATSKTTIAISSATILFLIASISLSASVRVFCIVHFGIVLVVIAVAGEVVCDWNRKKSLKERLKKFFGALLVAGLMLEIFEAIKADREIASLKISSGTLWQHLETTDIGLNENGKTFGKIADVRDKQVQIDENLSASILELSKAVKAQQEELNSIKTNIALMTNGATIRDGK